MQHEVPANRGAAARRSGREACREFCFCPAASTIACCGALCRVVSCADNDNVYPLREMNS